jgi:hypothetical protein
MDGFSVMMGFFSGVSFGACLAMAIAYCLRVRESER